VGDRVHITLTSPDQGVIDKIEERKTLLYRSDQYKSKLLAANLTQLFIVVATEPGFTDDLVSRALVAAEAAGIKAHLILNKTDVVEALPRTRERLAPYAALGYPVHEVSAKAQPEDTLACCAAAGRPVVDPDRPVRHGQVLADQPAGAGSRHRHARNLRPRSTPASTPPPSPACTRCPTWGRRPSSIRRASRSSASTI
jgi:hypothetical protein